LGENIFLAEKIIGQKKFSGHPNHSTTGYTTLPIAPEDRSRIKLRLPPEVKSDPLFPVFQTRKTFSSFACQHAREIFNRKTSFTDKLRLQKAIQAG